MKKVHDGIVRKERLEELIRDGVPHGSHPASKDEFRKKVLEKFKKDVAALGEHSTMGELAEIAEDLQSFAMANDIDSIDVEGARAGRVRKLGGFSRETILDWIEE